MRKSWIAVSLAAPALLMAQTAEPVNVIMGSRFEMAQNNISVHEGGIAFAPQAATAQFIAIDAGFNNAGVVKNAPYTAEAVTEFVQTLGDGTRITRRSTTKSARDSEGRTRTEPLGPVASPVGVELPVTITIHDPVGREMIFLNERERTAERIKNMAVPPPPPPSPPPPPPGAANGQLNGQVVLQWEMATPASAGAAGSSAAPVNVGVVAGTRAVRAVSVVNNRTSQRESTGKQVIAGVSCDATRITDSIPAGQIGNDREIRVVTDSCYSPELQMTLLTRTVDPINGETTFRVASLSRAEPPRSLFQVPAGYSVVESSGPVMEQLTPGVRTRVFRNKSN